MKKPVWLAEVLVMALYEELIRSTRSCRPRSDHTVTIMLAEDY